MRKGIEAGLIVPSIYVPSEVPTTRDHSGRRPAFVPEATIKTSSVKHDAQQSETRDSSEGVNDSGGASSPDAAGVGIDDGALVDEGIRWPDEISETAFLAEQPTVGWSPSADRAPEKTAPAAPKVPLPPLQELIDRIPTEAREALEDLFRGRFVSVRYAENVECRSGSAGVPPAI